MKKLILVFLFLLPVLVQAQRVTQQNLNQRLRYYQNGFKQDLELSYEAKIVELLYFNYIDRLNLIKRKLESYKKAKEGMDKVLKRYYSYTLGGLDGISPAEIVTLYSFQTKFSHYYNSAFRDKNELKKLMQDIESRNMCVVGDGSTEVNTVAEYFAVMFAPISLVNIPMDSIDYNSWSAGSASITGSPKGDFHYEGATMAIAVVSPVIGATFAVLGSAIKAIKQDDLDFEARNRFLDAVNAMLTYYNAAVVDLNSRARNIVQDKCTHFYKSISEDREVTRNDGTVTYKDKSSFERLRDTVYSFEKDLVDFNDSWTTMSDRIQIVETKYELQRIEVVRYLTNLELNSNQVVQEYLGRLESEVQAQTTYYRKKISREVSRYKKMVSGSGSLTELGSSLEKLMESTVEGDLKFGQGESDIYFRRKSSKLREIL